VPRLGRVHDVLVGDVAVGKDDLLDPLLREAAALASDSATDLDTVGNRACPGSSSPDSDAPRIPVEIESPRERHDLGCPGSVAHKAKVEVMEVADSAAPAPYQGHELRSMVFPALPSRAVGVNPASELWADERFRLWSSGRRAAIVSPTGPATQEPTRTWRHREAALAGLRPSTPAIPEHEGSHSVNNVCGDYT